MVRTHDPLTDQEAMCILLSGLKKPHGDTNPPSPIKGLFTKRVPTLLVGCVAYTDITKARCFRHLAFFVWQLSYQQLVIQPGLIASC